jgi:protein-L-isoaspartate(D-aspartate) O-methyltransferase
MIDAARQRWNMVESQVLTSDVTDRRILRAMGGVPRERFVPPALAALAYMDEAVPLSAPAGGRRWLMAPRVFAKLLQLAEIGEGNRVLDVGSGTGYSAAVLAKIAKSVVALECDATLAEEARRNLAALKLDNVSVAQGALAEGWADGAPYDAIVLEGSVCEPPAFLLDELKDGGRLVAVVRKDGLGRGTIWRRLGRSLDQWTAFDAAAPVLPGFEAAPAFVL